MLNDDRTGLISYNEINESMVFVDEQPMYPFEFQKNRILVTGYPSQMYLVEDWAAVKIIPETNPANTYKNNAFLMPGFDAV